MTRLIQSAKHTVVALLALGAMGCASVAWAQIRIGQVAGFTGTVAAGVKEVTGGAQLYLNAVNARGGVNGQTIELVSVDDAFKPENTAQEARKLITDSRVMALFLTRGTPHTQALLPLLAEYKIPLIAPSTGAMVLHDPVNPWVFNVRSTYQREAAEAIHHLATIGVTRIALLPTDDTFGADSAQGAMRGFEKARLKPVLVQKFAREKPDLVPVVQQVIDSRAQAVLVVASAGNTVNLVKALRAAGSRAQVVTLSNNASGGFIEQLGAVGRGVIVTQVFPNERRVNYRLIKEAQELAKARGMAGVSPAMMEGFAAAKVLVEGLRLAGSRPTPTDLRNALERINNFDLGGLFVSYSATDHTGLDFVDLSIVDGSGQFRR